MKPAVTSRPPSPIEQQCGNKVTVAVAMATGSQHFAQWLRISRLGSCSFSGLTKNEKPPKKQPFECKVDAGFRFCRVNHTSDSKKIASYGVKNIKNPKASFAFHISLLDLPCMWQQIVHTPRKPPSWPDLQAI